MFFRPFFGSEAPEFRVEISVIKCTCAVVSTDGVFWRSNIPGDGKNQDWREKSTATFEWNQAADKAKILKCTWSNVGLLSQIVALLAVSIDKKP